MTRRELTSVLATLLGLHLLLFLRGLPLPHHDAYFFTEPALYLAREGRLVAPSAEYLDLSYVLNFGAYPPVYFLALGGWFKIFDYSAGSLLAFTHFLHLLYLGVAWTLVRVRFQGSKLAAGLVVLSCFPLFNHGRPDLLASLLGTASFLALPDTPRRGRTLLTVVLLALTLGSSPALGISSISAVAIYQAFRAGRPTRASLGQALVLGAAGAGGGLLIWALVLTWQDSWWIAPAQFRVNSSIRGKNLNELPHLFELVSPYFIAFVYLPLLFAALFPAVLALVRKQDPERHHLLPLAALAYFGGFLPLALTNKLQLLYQHHFALAARVPLHGALLASTGRFRLLGVLAVLGFTASQFFLNKDLWLYAFMGDLRYETLDPQKLAGVRVLAVDSNCAPAFFGRFQGILLDYDIIKFNQWRGYRAKTPPEILARLPARLARGPEVPDAIVITTRGHYQIGAPNPALFEKVSGPPLDALAVFGVPLRQAERPFALHVYRRRSGAPVPESL